MTPEPPETDDPGSGDMDDQDPQQAPPPEPEAPAETPPGAPDGEAVHTDLPAEIEDNPELRIVELEERVQALTDRVQELEDQVEHRTNQLARVQADFENYRKRVAREKDELERDTRAEMVGLLADVLDDLGRAAEAAEGHDKVLEGLRMVDKRITKRLDELGVVRIEPEAGDELRPEAHEALMTVTTDDVPDGTVAACLQPGYEIDGKLVRPALIQVAQAPEDDA